MLDNEDDDLDEDDIAFLRDQLDEAAPVLDDDDEVGEEDGEDKVTIPADMLRRALDEIERRRSAD